MQIYHFKVYFSDGFVADYAVNASTTDMAFDIMMKYADCDAIEYDCEIVNYELRAIEKNISRNY